jgi:hypothetical protein
MIDINDNTAVELLNNYFDNLPKEKIKNLVQILIQSCHDTPGSIDLLISSINEPDKVRWDKYDMKYDIQEKYLVSKQNVHLTSKITKYHEEQNTFIHIDGVDHIPVTIKHFLPFSPGHVIITDGKYLHYKIYISYLKEFTADLLSDAYTNKESQDELHPF